MQVQTNIKKEVCSGLLKMFCVLSSLKKTARAYEYRLQRYCNDRPFQDPNSLLTMTQKEGEDSLIQFIITKKDVGMSSSALSITMSLRWPNSTS